MSLIDFPKDIVVRTMDTNETVEIASFTDTGPLKSIRMYILAENLTGDETLTLELRASNGTTVLGTSEPFTLSTAIGSTPDPYWLGWVRFDFTVPPNLGTGVRLFVTAANYTNVEDVNVINILTTFLNPTYATSAVTMSTFPADLQIYKLD